MISATQWNDYERDGFLRLGHVCSTAELTALQRRIDEIMLGTAPVDYDRMLMQLDSDSGRYADAPAQSKGFKGARLDYRKIQDLEFDPLFAEFMRLPVFREICGHVYGPGTSIAAFRAMFMNKPAGKGTWLPWHQDRWTNLDLDPLVTVWTALDPATIANGCMQVIPGSHRLGIINREHHSAFLNPEQSERYCPPSAAVPLELAVGETLLLHNWLVHASGVNRTDQPRRAFSVCYMDARTKAANGEVFSVIM